MTYSSTVFLPLDFVDGGRVIEVGQPASSHSLNTINTKYRETLQKTKTTRKQKHKNATNLFKEITV